MRPPNDSKQRIAQKLRELREERGYTQSDIGRVLGRAYTTVASWESGKGQPDADTLLRLLAFYGVENILEQFGYAPRRETLSPQEAAHLTCLRALTPEARGLAVDLTEGLSRLSRPAPLRAVARGNAEPAPFALGDAALLEALPDEGWRGEDLP